MTQRDSNFFFEGAIFLAHEVLIEGNFSSLTAQVEVSSGEPSWDLAGLPVSWDDPSMVNPLARSADVVFFRLDPDEYDKDNICDGDSDSRVILVEATLKGFEGYVRESGIFVTGGARIGTGLLAVAQRHPKVWVSRDFGFRTKFFLDMRG